MQRWRPPPRHGVSAVKAMLSGRVPDDGRTYLAAAAGDSPYESGTLLAPGLVLAGRTPTWVYPDFPEEPEELLAADIPVLYSGSDAVVVDKPHGLPSTPNGRLLRATAQSLMRVRLQEPELVAAHRLDRDTRGLLVLARNPVTRGFLQTQFQRREVSKTYQALAADIPEIGSQWQDVQLPMLKIKDDPQVKVVDGERSRLTVTRIRKLASSAGAEARPVEATRAGTPTAVYELQPLTGYTHQLRVLMNHLGAPIYGDDTYPEYRPGAGALRLRAVAIELALVASLKNRQRIEIERCLEDPWAQWGNWPSWRAGPR
ncbi:pseudouridine synthase [Corynebacterium jeikeium]|uniref:pseudouridine synthase n=1 Tax=Corynebacterium jeikeium TaxID=38289 RepID=UPI001E497C20|nr:pseudouridine synthase [Corynebacterium jeikeium]